MTTNELGRLVNPLLWLGAQSRLMHWQTPSFAEHQVWGGFYDSLGELTDSLVEEAVGALGPFELDETSCCLDPLRNYQDVNTSVLLDFMESVLIQQFSRIIPSNRTDLYNLRDELLGAVGKLRYLLTLK